MNKVGRNDKCYCGSNKKYKRCCINKSTKGELGFLGNDDDGYLITPTKENMGEDVYYHITTEKCIENILNDGFICGSKSSNRGDMKFNYRNGKLWVVDTNNEWIWNGISYMEIHKSTLDLFGRDGKPYYVLGITQSTLDKYGLTPKHNKDCKYEITNMWEKEIIMGNKTIPTDELIFCGKYITDGDKWETKVKWEITKLMMEKKLGVKDYDLNGFTIHTPILGCVSYEDRYEKTMKKLYPTTQSKMDYFHSDEIDRDMDEYISLISKVENSKEIDDKGFIQYGNVG